MVRKHKGVVKTLGQREGAKGAGEDNRGYWSGVKTRKWLSLRATERAVCVALKWPLVTMGAIGSGRRPTGGGAAQG